MLIVVGLAMPHVCMAGGLSDTATKVIMTDHQDSSHNDLTASMDHCCVAGHGCAAKILNQSDAFVVSSTVHQAPDWRWTSQSGISHIPQGLERPPKSIL